jgi:hypothetical protein
MDEDVREPNEVAVRDWELVWADLRSDVRALHEKLIRLSEKLDRTETHLSTQFAELRALLVVPAREPDAPKTVSERASEKSH